MNRLGWLAVCAAGTLMGAAKVDVIAHRGEHIECPENTLPTIENAIALGVDWVEIDVRTSKDGAFVLMHDSGVERTTGGKGQIADLTLDEIRGLDAGSQKGGFAGTKVPTLDEALATMRGKCGIYFDAKRISADAIVAGLKKQGMVERCVVYGGLRLMQALTDLGFGFLAMPEAVSVEVSRRILTELQVRTIAFDCTRLSGGDCSCGAGGEKGYFCRPIGASRYRREVAGGSNNGGQGDPDGSLRRIGEGAAGLVELFCVQLLDLPMLKHYKVRRNAINCSRSPAERLKPNS